jgi:acyl dehydratase
MPEQIYFEDVDVGTKLPALAKHPTPRQLVMFCSATGDYTEYHYNKDYALSQNLPDIIVQGDIIAAYLVQVVTDWMGEWGTLRRFRNTNRKSFFLNEDIICKGTVSKKFVEGREHFVECEIWAENRNGEKCVLATALVTLPSRLDETQQ